MSYSIRTPYSFSILNCVAFILILRTLVLCIVQPLKGPIADQLLSCCKYLSEYRIPHAETYKKHFFCKICRHVCGHPINLSEELVQAALHFVRLHPMQVRSFMFEGANELQKGLERVDNQDVLLRQLDENPLHKPHLARIRHIRRRMGMIAGGSGGGAAGDDDWDDDAGEAKPTPRRGRRIKMEESWRGETHPQHFAVLERLEYDELKELVKKVRASIKMVSFSVDQWKQEALNLPWNRPKKKMARLVGVEDGVDTVGAIVKITPEGEEITGNGKRAAAGGDKKIRTYSCLLCDSYYKRQNLERADYHVLTEHFSREFLEVLKSTWEADRSDPHPLEEVDELEPVLVRSLSIRLYCSILFCTALRWSGLSFLSSLNTSIWNNGSYNQ